MPTPSDASCSTTSTFRWQWVSTSLTGKAFRFGHLGYTNDATIIGALAAVEMGLELARVPHDVGGVDAALSYLTQGDRDSEVRTTERLLATKRNGSGNLFAQASI